MKKIGSFKLRGIDLEIFRTKYADGNLAVTIHTAGGEPYAKLSVNLPEIANMLEPDQFFVKTWSENEAIVKVMRELEIFKPTGREVEVSQWCTSEIWQINE